MSMLVCDTCGSLFDTDKEGYFEKLDGDCLCSQCADTEGLLDIIDGVYYG